MQQPAAFIDIAASLAPVNYRTRDKVLNSPARLAQLADWLALHARPDGWVVMEAAGIHHEALAVSVDGWGYRVCVVNPAQVADYARSESSRTKTDRTDAKLSMRFAQGHAERLRRSQS